MPRLLWVQKQDIGPPPSSYLAMCYDSTRQRTLLFNGGTWEWDGEIWTQVEDMGPGSRFNPAMVHDSARSVTVLFGGYSSGGGGTAMGDTWEWDGASWIQVADTGPAGRSGHAMVFDAARQRTLLFGGFAPLGVRDTWEWDGTEWTQQEDSGPAARAGHAMAYDSARDRTVLFGGEIGISSSTSFIGSDTWEWNGIAWTQVSDIGPSARSQHRMASDGTAVVLFGGSSFGRTAPDPLVPDTWEWDGHVWRQTQDMGPSRRYGHGLSYDSARQRMVLFGGTLVIDNKTPVGDTWERYARPGPGDKA